ncbi:MAG TPA: hypothetical protein DD412_08835 [Holosporales bacterium]|nr:hypothetical protein [Holosporales bacterium]
MARKQPFPDIKKLYGLAAARCNFPECKIDLILENPLDTKSKQIGKIAHIIAHSNNGPRSDNSYPPSKIDTYDNWILLCGTHHDIIDTNVDQYPVQKLHKMKSDHEAWVQMSLNKAVMNISFPELEVTAKAIMSNTFIDEETSFEILPPIEKIKKNSLTQNTHNLLITGIARSREVATYLKSQSKLDNNFPKKLKKGFLEEYGRLTSEGIQADDLFNNMLEFANGNNYDFKRQAAGLAILTHLFEICEVFEK